MSAWIDFKELRKQLDFEKVLTHYKVKVNAKGDQHHGFCPLPTHQGVRNSPSFSANLTRGIWQCFGCGAKGNVLEFSVRMENLNPDRGEDLRTVALALQRQFQLQPANAPASNAPPKSEPPVHPRPSVVNAPLDFDLKRLDPNHPYLLGRGFLPATIARFGLGFCSRGMLANRIAIPLHDDTGKLVGFAGRVVDDAQIGEDSPKYRFPGTREREGVVHEFRKSLFVYNGWRIPRPVDDLVVVEGFASVWLLVQLGFASVVGLMGSDCSERQAEIILGSVTPTGRIWVMPDGDEAGVRCAESAIGRLVAHRLVRWVKLDPDRQPTDCNRDELAKRLPF